MNKHKGNSISELKWEIALKKRKQNTEMKAQWSVGKWINWEREYENRSWVDSPMLEKPTRLRFLGSAPGSAVDCCFWPIFWGLGFGFSEREMNAREAGNYSVRTVGENILGVYIEGDEDISHVHCTWHEKVSGPLFEGHGGLASQIGPAKIGVSCCWAINIVA